MAATIPTGNYPKMVTIGAVPAVYPAGDAKQYKMVIFNNSTEEKAYANNGVATVSTIASGTGNSWENRHGK